MSNLARLGRGELIDWSDVAFFEAVASESAPQSSDWVLEDNVTSPRYLESQIDPRLLQAGGYYPYEDVPYQQLLGALPQGPSGSTQAFVITAAVITVVGAAAFYFLTRKKS